MRFQPTAKRKRNKVLAWANYVVIGTFLFSGIFSSLFVGPVRIASAQVAGPCTPVSAAGLSGHWKLDENTGTLAADSAGGNNTGTLMNGPAWVAGVPAVSPNPSALSFDGSDDQVDVSNSGDFSYGTSNFTVSLFAKAGAAAGDRSVLGNFSGRGWGLYFYSTNRVNFFGYGDVGTNDTSHAATLLDDNWHHVAGVYTRAGSSLTIDAYVDGAYVGTNTATVGDISSTSALLFGKYLGQPNYMGTLDDIRIYGRALSAAEVSDLSKGCGDPPPPPPPCSDISAADLAAHWKLNEGSGVDAVDSTSYDNHGTVLGSAAWSAAGAPLIAPNPASLSFDGSNDYVLDSDTTGLPSGGSARTISLWMYADELSHQGTLVSLGNSSSGNQKFILQMGNEPASGPTYLFTDGVNGANNVTVSGGEIPTLAAWHHVAFSMDATGAWKYYLDGVLTKSGVFPVAINTVTNDVEIGARHDAATGYFKGKLDDVRVWGRVLSAVEVDALADGCGSNGGGSSSSSSSTTSSSTSSSSSSSSNGTAPKCNGMTATIYVKNGKIVGGPMNGQDYHGILRGTPGNDVIKGTNRPDMIGGKGGDDVICGDKGNDLIYGDAGNDTILAGNGKNTVFGNAGDDHITSGNGHNLLFGNLGDDTLHAGNGNNILDGGQGTDHCTAGRGRNIFLRCEEPEDEDDDDEDDDDSDDDD